VVKQGRHFIKNNYVPSDCERQLLNDVSRAVDVCFANVSVVQSECKQENDGKTSVREEMLTEESQCLY